MANEFDDLSPLKPTRQADLVFQDVCGCGDKAFITLHTVEDRAGREWVKAAGEVSQFGQNSNYNWMLRDGYTLRYSTPYCSRCWEGKEKPQPSKWPEEKIREAWMYWLPEFHGELANGIAGKRRSATPEQAEAMLRAINHEAKRCNEPTAIPNQYKLAEVWDVR